MNSDRDEPGHVLPPELVNLDGLPIVDAILALLPAGLSDTTEPGVLGYASEVDGRWAQIDSERFGKPMTPAGIRSGILTWDEPDAYQVAVAAQTNRFTDSVRPLFDALRSGALVAAGERVRDSEQAEVRAYLWRVHWRLTRASEILETEHGGTWREEFRGLDIHVRRPAAPARLPSVVEIRDATRKPRAETLAMIKVYRELLDRSRLTGQENAGAAYKEVMKHLGLALETKFYTFESFRKNVWRKPKN